MGMTIDECKDILEDVVAYMASYGSAFPSEVYANQSYSEICNAIRTLEKLADKADYEARLKADMVAMLEELKQDIIAEAYGIEMDCTDYVVNVADIDKIIQVKINVLRENMG